MEKNSGMFSIREIYRIGRGPSSSHTMAPSYAVKQAIDEAKEADSYKITLYGSLAKTGKGHRTDYAIDKTLGGKKAEIIFNTEKHNLPHPNTMDIEGFQSGKSIYKKTFLSVGGGAVDVLGEAKEQKDVIYEENNFMEITEIIKKENITLADYVFSREGKELRSYLKSVWNRMKGTIDSGLKGEGVIPGGLNVKRKAKMLYETGKSKEFGHEKELYLISAYAYAASEENAIGELMVTAPTCGASGVLPAVLLFKQQERGYSDEQIVNALAVAGIVGNVIKHNASISGAECGCQAEIGSAWTMAAAAFAYLKGLNTSQIECAAEIALEHHLGLTCDPVCGLVQIPCIERNAVAAMRSVDAVALATMLFENRKISFDSVVKTMYETGRDLSYLYRETSEGGLAKLKIN